MGDCSCSHIASVLPAPQEAYLRLQSEPAQSSAPTDLLLAVLAVHPPRNDAERVEPVLARSGACEADFPADFLRPPAAHDRERTMTSRSGSS